MPGTASAEAFPDLEFSRADGLLRAESREAIRVSPLVRLLEEQGDEVMEARRRIRPSLEDVFIAGDRARGRAHEPREGKGGQGE